MHPTYDKPLPEGWQGGAPVTKYWGGSYVHLYRLTRACATCTAEISLDVTKGALDGTKKNAGLLLRNCPKCRAERKAGGVGSRGGRSRPVAGDAPAQAVADTTELEALRAAVVTMKEELEGLYAQNKELREQLAQHELDAINGSVVPALDTLGDVKPLNPVTEELRREWIKKNNVKMPWEGG